MTRKIGNHSGVLGRGRWAARGVLALGAVFLWAAVGARAQGTPSYAVLHTFTGADGEYPGAGLVRDWEGNLYSTAFLGGDLSKCGGSGCGVVFKLDPASHETPLHPFTGGADGYGPYGDLLLDEAGHLYGTASKGGDVSGFCGDMVQNADNVVGCGTVYKLDRTGEFTVLHIADAGGSENRDTAGELRSREGPRRSDNRRNEVGRGWRK